MNVLIVSFDNRLIKDVSNAVQLSFMQQGTHIVSTSSGIDAISRLKNQKYDLIVTDKADFFPETVRDISDTVPMIFASRARGTSQPEFFDDIVKFSDIEPLVQSIRYVVREGYNTEFPTMEAMH